ncbi:MAG TPA: methyltransferase domain-containing protein [Acidimicrobiia bacterium]
MSSHTDYQTSADRVQELIANGPDVNLGTRFGIMTRVARRMIGRAALYERHYHHQIELGLLEMIQSAVHDEEERRHLTEQEANTLQARLSSVERRVGDVADVASRLVDVTGRLDDVDTRSAVAASIADNATEIVERLGDDLSTLRSAVTSLQDRVSALVRDAHTLVTQVEAARGDGEKARFLYDDLTSIPYMADEDIFRGRDRSGRRTLAFCDGPGPAALYPGFEDIFRGPTALVAERQSTYVELLRAHAPVLDLGCGRGEMLALLSAAEVPASGVDLDLAMVERARTLGVSVDHGDALLHLAKEDDQSLGAVFSAQFIEHVPKDRLPELLELAYAKLAPGGVFVAETVNPHSPRALKSFWVDPTHQHPLFPETMLALCRLTGFDAAEVVFPAGSDDLETDMRTCGEYAVVATRRGIE